MLGYHKCDDGKRLLSRNGLNGYPPMDIHILDSGNMTPVEKRAFVGTMKLKTSRHDHSWVTSPQSNDKCPLTKTVLVNKETGEE